MKFNTAYSKRTPVKLDTGIGLTKQSHIKECDINNIMARYQKTGAISHMNNHASDYGFASSDDLHAALNTVNRANEMFNDLPSSIRTKFGNDPGLFLDFVQNPENMNEMVELGLANKSTETSQPDVSLDSNGDDDLSKDGKVDKDSKNISDD